VSHLAVDGFSVSVRDFVCEPFPPTGEPSELRFTTTTDFDTTLRGQVDITFTANGSSYRGTFRLTSATLGPQPSKYTYASVGPVEIQAIET
jgi:hypothetical protein